MAGPYYVRLRMQGGESLDLAVREAPDPLAAYTLAVEGVAQARGRRDVAYGEVYQWPEGVPFPTVYEEYGGIGAKMGVRVEDTLDRYNCEHEGFKWYVREYGNGRRTLVRKADGQSIEMSGDEALESYYSDGNPLAVPGSVAEAAEAIVHGP